MKLSRQVRALCIMCVLLQLAVKRRSLHTLASGWRAPVESIPEAQTRPVLG